MCHGPGLPARALHALLTLSLLGVDESARRKAKASRDLQRSDKEDGEATRHELERSDQEAGDEAPKQWITRTSVNGTIEKYEFISRTSFYNQTKGLENKLNANGEHVKVFVVLTTERLFLFHTEMPSCTGIHIRPPNSREHREDSRMCYYPQEDDSLDVGTAMVNGELSSPLASHLGMGRGSSQPCVELIGCTDNGCKGGQRTWNLCGDAATVWAFSDEVENAYFKLNNIQETLRSSIEAAIYKCKITSRITSNTPDAFSPYMHSSGGVTREGVLHLHKLMRSFQAGPAIAYRPGKNSRSGASFFFSQDQAYIAKRIRLFELDAFWEAVKDGVYGEHVSNGSSLMNPVFLGYQSGGDSWIVMAAESLPAGITALLPGHGTRTFFLDVKPSPMTSDREDASEKFLIERVLHGMHADGLEHWTDAIKKKAYADFKFLDGKGLVDYSLLVHGAFFTMPDEEEASVGPPPAQTYFGRHRSRVMGWTSRSSPNASAPITWYDELKSLVQGKPGCAAGCLERADEAPARRPLADVTQLLGKQNRVKHTSNASGSQMIEFKCCCMVPRYHGDMHTVLSPCALVSTSAPSQSFFANKDSCRNLMPETANAWKGYWNVPEMQGRCLVGLGVFNTSNFPAKPGVYLAPEAVGIMKPETSIRPRCLVICVSILDYLLPLTFANWMENVALMPIYGAAKWSWYQQKMETLLDCLAFAPLPQTFQTGLPFFLPAQEVSRGLVGKCGEVESIYKSREEAIGQLVFKGLTVAPANV